MMESFLKKVSKGEFDESVHSELIKFSKGIFENRYLINAKKQKDKWAIKTGAEFANFLVRSCLESSSSKIKVKGVIVSTLDLSKDINFGISGTKQFMGVKQHIIDTDV